LKIARRFSGGVRRGNAPAPGKADGLPRVQPSLTGRKSFDLRRLGGKRRGFVGRPYGTLRRFRGDYLSRLKHANSLRFHGQARDAKEDGYDGNKPGAMSSLSSTKLSRGDHQFHFFGTCLSRGSTGRAMTRFCNGEGLKPSQVHRLRSGLPWGCGPKTSV
jgi:hypothetical protein